MGVYVCLCFIVHSFCVLFSFAIVLKRKRDLVSLFLLSYGCFVTITVLRLFLTVPWVGLRCVIVVFPDHTHLLYNSSTCTCFRSYSLAEWWNLSWAEWLRFNKELGPYQNSYGNLEYL